MIFPEDTHRDRRLLRAGIPVAFLRMKDMPSPVLTKPDTRAFFHRLVGLLDISGHYPDRLRLRRQDHPAGQDLEGDDGPVFLKNAADHGTKPVTPAAISIITIIYGGRHINAFRHDFHRPKV